MRYSILTLIIIIPLLSACAAKRPVLYPNAKLKSVGNTTAQADVNTCIELANTGGAGSNVAKEATKTGAKGAAIGGATGAVSGAIYGRPGRGAAVGAAGGATAGLTHSILNSDEPDPIFSRFVERCLRDEGYDVIGWR